MAACQLQASGMTNRLRGPTSFRNLVIIRHERIPLGGKTVRVALYARVSTRDKGQDPEVQLLQLRRFAQMKGWEVYAECTDKASGKTPIRPGPDRLLKEASQNKFEAILVLRIDRIMRSVKHFINLNETLDVYGVRIISVSDGMDYATPIGKLVRGILMQVAEFEVEQLSQRVREGIEKARSEGKALGRKRVEVDIRKARELLAEGISTRDVAKMLGCSQGTLLSRLREVRNGTTPCSTNPIDEIRE